MLAAKNVKWVSHYLDVIQGEHLTHDFLSFNPKGSVPVLVHADIVIGEPLDIVRYLDKVFPSHTSEPNIPKDEQLLWILAASAVGQHIKILSFEFLIKALPFLRDNGVSQTKVHHLYGQSSGLYRHLSNHDRIDKNEIIEALQAVNRALHKLEEALKNQPYLAGKCFSSADIAWLVQLYRLRILKLSELDYFPEIMKWYNKLQGEPAVQRGMLDWAPKLLYDKFDAYADQRKRTGDDINSPLWREQPFQIKKAKD